jgi:hypothetical protein
VFWDARADRLYLPRGVSALTALAPGKDWRAYLRWAREAGFDFFRTFAGALTWADQSAASARAGIPALLDYAQELGLGVELTAITDSREGGYDPEEHVALIADQIRASGHPAVLVEGGNELGHPTQHEDVDADHLREWGRRHCHDLLWAVGSTGDELTAPPDSSYDGHGGRYATAHLDRGRDLLNQIRRLKEMHDITERYGIPTIDNERLGADSRDGSETGRQRTNQPWFFYAAGVLNRGFSRASFHHSQAGLHCEIPDHVQRACAAAELEGHRVVESVLGVDTVPDFINAGHGGSPVTNPGGSEAFEDRGHDGGAQGPFIRAYSFTSGDRAVTCALHRPETYPEGVLTWGNGWAPARAVTTHPHVTVIESRR